MNTADYRAHIKWPKQPLRISPLQFSSRYGTQQIVVNFPDRCIYCGAPPGTLVPVAISNRLATSPNSCAEYSTQFAVPYCDEHARETKRFQRAQSLGALAGFLAGFVLSALLLINTFIEQRSDSLWGLVLVGAGVPAYFLWKRWAGTSRA